MELISQRNLKHTLNATMFTLRTNTLPGSWPVFMAITLMWEHAMTENSSNEWVKINKKIGRGAEGKRGQRNDKGPKRVALVCEQCCPLFFWVGVLVWIGGPGAVIAGRNVSLVKGCALTTGCHCPCKHQFQKSGVTDHNLDYELLLANLVLVSPWEVHQA